MEIIIDDNQFTADRIDLFGSSLLCIRGNCGFLGCGYFNPATADKLGHALAIVSGVKTFDDMLNAEVKSVSAKAAELGVRPGMTGKDALKLFA